MMGCVDFWTFEIKRNSHSKVMQSSIYSSPFVRYNLRSSIRQRCYHVQSPNYVWNIDGNHELIGWRIVAHGGIDGFSRVLRQSTYNLATTSMLSGFVSEVSEYVRACSDLGGENVVVWRYMQRNNPSCVIVGSSTHNERIERLEGCSSLCFEAIWLSVSAS